MGGVVLDATVQLLLEKLLAVVAEEIGLFRGFKNELKNLEKSLETIQAFLRDASKRQIEEDHSVKRWLRDLEDVAYEADDLLDHFTYQVVRSKVEFKGKVCCSFSFSCLGSVAFRCEMGHKIKNLNVKLKIVNDVASSYGLQKRVADSAFYLPPVMETNSIVVDPIFIGRDDTTSEIIGNMINSSHELMVSVVPIVGMGGLGKTTLARKVFNHQDIVKHFNQRIWVSLSKNVDNKSLLIKILESLSKKSVDVSLGEEAVLSQLQSQLKDARFLLVLDDYLNEKTHEWDNFMNCIRGINLNKGNFIMVTTRNQNVTSTMKPCNENSLGFLSNGECWEIIKARAFPSHQMPEDFVAIGKEIACTCRGLPLAANVVGGSLRGKEIDDWRLFLESSNRSPNDDVVLQVLKVSFDRLPSSLLKKCFAYCSIFSKGEIIERQRLIQLWMAEGFLCGSSDGSDHDMESRGDKVYNILLENFFLHEPVRDKYGKIKYSKMHDLVHDLSSSVAKPKYDDDVTSRIRYLSVDEKVKIKKEQGIYIRTLFVNGYVSELIDNMFEDCKYLRVLDLHKTNIKELTSSIDKLIHLRFLDLSYTEIKSLPDSVCKLYNLQTLRLIWCSLPDQLRFLVGLRHLVFKSPNYASLGKMPLEIGKLTDLRTLELFIVGKEKGRQIAELGYLKNLQGKLTIYNLEEVNGKEESMRACLFEKQNIEKLEFVWSYRSSRESKNNDYEVLEGLQPHPNLKDLAIENFTGDHFPSWTRKMTVESGIILHKLIKIVLIYCENCEEIPTLGHLPLLKILTVRGLKNVRSIGPSFYVPDRYRHYESSRCSVPFPALERLQLRDMDNLREWVEAPNTGATAFPKLEYLEISSCNNLMTAPSHVFSSLKELTIYCVDSEVPLARICSKLSSLTKLTLYSISNLTSLPDMLFYNNKHLQRLRIHYCYNLTQLKLWDSLESLHNLDIVGCRNLPSIQYQTTHLKGFTSLRHLTISYCNMLTELPSEMLESCTSLEVLQMYSCPNLRCLPNGMDCLNKLTGLHIGPFSEETGFTLLNETLKGGHESLRELSLCGKSNWESFPDQVQHLTALTRFDLYDFGIEALPVWFSNMSSLKTLQFCRCERLRRLTSLRHLTQLEELYIRECTTLEEAFTQSSTADHSQWPDISHIPNIFVNGIRIQFQLSSVFS